MCGGGLQTKFMFIVISLNIKNYVAYYFVFELFLGTWYIGPEIGTVSPKSVQLVTLCMIFFFVPFNAYALIAAQNQNFLSLSWGITQYSCGILVPVQCSAADSKRMNISSFVTSHSRIHMLV